ncbi:MAG: 2-isopropylmalate synthase [Myxococcota bacterium]|nr:2-isopropylmalate synthase [Myxococcota bacterium]
MEKNVIYDWNQMGDVHSPPMSKVSLFDETLRDGIQCPSATDPSIDKKLEILRLLDKNGVDSADIGLPGAGPRAVEDVRILVEAIRDEGMSIRPAAAARTHPNDIKPIIEISQQTGFPIEIYAFLGSSPIRLYTEGWDESRLEKLTRDAVKLGKSANLPFCFVTEDTVRSNPQTLNRLFPAAIEEGADRLCLCDTVGHATPNGVFNLVYFAKNLIRAMGTETKIDWHGHSDRGLSLPNALNAIEAGVDRVHGTILGIGERVGNTNLDLLLVNLKLLGVIDNDLSFLSKLVDSVAHATDWTVPVNYPVFGRDAFRTGTGVHAAAVIKALRKGDPLLADLIYSGVPASWFGKEQEIEIGPMAGNSNIIYWLEKNGYSSEEANVQRLRQAAKSTDRILESDALHALLKED